MTSINIMCLETKAARKYYRQAIKQALRANAPACFTMTLCDSDLLAIVLNRREGDGPNASIRTAARLAQTCKQFLQATIDAHLDVALHGEQVGLAYLALTAPPAHWQVKVMDLRCTNVVDVAPLASLVGLKELHL